MRRSLSASAFRQRLKAACDRVCDEREPLLVERRDGRDVVVLAREDYESLVETAYLLSSPANARRLHEALTRDPAERRGYPGADELARDLGA